MNQPMDSFWQHRAIESAQLWTQALSRLSQIRALANRALGAVERIDQIQQIAAATDTPADPNSWHVLADIQAERARQDAKWGGPSHDDTISIAYFSETIRAFLAKTGADTGYINRRHRFIQIAALAVAAVESIDRRALPTQQPIQLRLADRIEAVFIRRRHRLAKLCKQPELRRMIERASGFVPDGTAWLDSVLSGNDLISADEATSLERLLELPPQQLSISDADDRKCEAAADMLIALTMGNLANLHEGDKISIKVTQTGATAAPAKAA